MKSVAAAISLASFVLGGLAGCGSGGSKTVTVTSTASSSSSSTQASPQTIPGLLTTRSGGARSTTTSSSPPPATFSMHLATFKTPSGNIGCTIIAGTARCDIGQRSWSPPARPSGCPQIVDFGQGLIVGRAGPAQFVCAGDTARDPSAKVLPYNVDTLVGPFRCASRTSGITCTNTRTAHGFFIAIQGYRAF